MQSQETRSANDCNGMTLRIFRKLHIFLVKQNEADKVDLLENVHFDNTGNGFQVPSNSNCINDNR